MLILGLFSLLFCVVYFSENRLLINITPYEENFYYVPPTKGWTYCCWCGYRWCWVRIASCLHSISCNNGWILTKLAQTRYWDGGKKWWDFGDHDLIFKVTPALWIIKFWQKSLSTSYLLNQMTDSGQTSCIVMLCGLKIWLDFGDLDLIFKVTTL